jgi:hypothetical protein
MPPVLTQSYAFTLVAIEYMNCILVLEFSLCKQGCSSPKRTLMRGFICHLLSRAAVPPSVLEFFMDCLW